MSDADNKRIVRNARQARAGFRDFPVAVVLAVGIGLVIVAFLLVYLFYFGRH